MCISSHMLCVPILPLYLLSVSVYSCIIFIWGMKQTNIGGCNFEVITFDYISISLKKTLEMSAKCAQQRYDFNIPDLLCPKPLIITGSHSSLLPSISKHLEKFTIVTDRIIHTLKNDFVCF